MKRLLLPLVLLAALAPAAALAAGPEVLDLRTGVTADMLAKTLGIARAFFPLALVLAILVEAFGGGPTDSKHYGALVGRALLVLVLLAGYGRLFGTVINTTEKLADRIAPQDTWDRYKERVSDMAASLALRRSPSGAEGSARTDSGLVPSSESVANYLGGFLFDSLIGLFVLVGHGLHWVFGQLSRILLAVFYILGPLALVWHVIQPVKTAGRWFTSFVTLASWPVLSALLLTIAAALMPRAVDASQAGDSSAAFGAVASSLLVMLLDVAVPYLASALIGGSVGNLIGSSAAGLLATTLAARSAMKGMFGPAPAAAGAGSPAGGGAIAGPAGTPAGDDALAQNAGAWVIGAEAAASVPPGGPPEVPRAFPAQGQPEAGSAGPMHAPGANEAAAVPLVAEPPPHYMPEQPSTVPGHPFDPRRDWGDFAHLKPIGPELPSQKTALDRPVRPSPIFQPIPAPKKPPGPDAKD